MFKKRKHYKAKPMTSGSRTINGIWYVIYKEVEHHNKQGRLPNVTELAESFALSEKQLRKHLHLLETYGCVDSVFM